MLTKDKGEGNFSAHVKLTQLRIKSNHRGRVYKSLYYSLGSKYINSQLVSFGYFWYRVSVVMNTIQPLITMSFMPSFLFLGLRE